MLKRKKGPELQAEYYAESADTYARQHVRPDDDHSLALGHILALMKDMGLRSVLDVGCGTGRAVSHFLDHFPAEQVAGIEPVAALMESGAKADPRLRQVVRLGKGEALPFADQSFDVVTSFGILHHIEHPDAVVKEMLRVARRAVFLSDSNRFGQGSKLARWLKVSLYAVGLWRLANYLKLRGKPYSVLEGDGIVYSYSLFDSYPLLERWADTVLFIPARPLRRFLYPLTSFSTFVLAGLKRDSRLPVPAPTKKESGLGV